MSLTAGPRGASVNFGRRGTYFNTGIPGTGLYARTRLDGPDAEDRRPAVPNQQVLVNLKIEVDTEGVVTYNWDGKPAIPYLVSKAKREHGNAIRAMLEDTCQKQNAPAKALAAIHVETPPPTARVKFSPREFGEAAPVAPTPKAPGFLGWLFKSTAERIAAENSAATAKHQAEVIAWQARKDAFEVQEADRKNFLENRVFSDPTAMEQHLEHALQDIEWPRETLVSFEISDAGKSISLDVDLPESEDMPTRTWNLPAHGFQPTVKTASEGQVLKMYSRHVQGVGFRIIGEAFALLPSIMTVTLSAYSQRAKPATGAVADEYLYSVRVARDMWSRINFQNLASLDVSAALGEFEIRRKMGKSGRFEEIEPLTSGDVAATRLTAGS